MKATYVIVFFMVPLLVQGQKFDNNWVIGHDINPGYYHTRLCDEIGRGYSAGDSSAVILQLPASDSIYYMFHSSIKYIPPPQEDAYVDRLLHSIIKTSANKKLVLGKNTPIIIDSLASGELNAVKHANGKVWWVIQPKRLILVLPKPLSQPGMVL